MAGAIIADVPLDLDVHRLGDADRDRVGRRFRVQHPPITARSSRERSWLQSFIQCADRAARQIDLYHWRCQE